MIALLWGLLFGLPWRALRWYAELCEAYPSAPILQEAPLKRADLRLLSSEGIALSDDAEADDRWYPLSEMPLALIGAFVAAEDKDFFDHDGISAWSIARAALVNLRESATVQGGSTITQQLAKSFVGSEKSLERKLAEAVLARRIEQRYSKEEILEAYLNRIYLGAGAYGVGAAAQRYFGKAVSKLSLEECTLLAGLAPSPSRSNPFHNPVRARLRRVIVLERMVKLGLIDRARAEQAAQAPLLLAQPPRRSIAMGYAASSVAEEFRHNEELQALRGSGKLLVFSTIQGYLQERAVSLVREQALTLGQRRGDPAVLLHLEEHERAAFLADAGRLQGLIRREGERYLGVVTQVEPLSMLVDTGGVVVHVSDGASWVGSALDTVFSVGDVVQLRSSRDSVMGLPVAGELLPSSLLQGALLSMDERSGAVRAIAGGTDFSVTPFNRAQRACRQPGSVFKPVVYSLALESGYQVASRVVDLPISYETQGGELIWTPRNADRDFQGELSLVDALARSRNVPTVKLSESLGLGRVIAHARRLGLTTPMRATPALVLGASCVQLPELTQMYALFANGGLAIEAHGIARALTVAGDLVYDRGSFGDPGVSFEAQLRRLLEPAPARLLSAEKAFLVDWLLRQVVQRGTAHAAASLPFPVAGKTGTTNRFDVWFVGYAGGLVSSVWLGDDLNLRPLEEKETGGTSALPVWMAFMSEAVGGAEFLDPRAHTPAGIEWLRIDAETGELAHAEGRAVSMPFLRGTGPTRRAASPTQRKAQAADILDRSF
ncbi:MAG: transglycosylase domain-containing protein [Myxococcota bacterium]|nr:transglycosylase domain-containing protein [Myxococcota bacterium]